MKKFLLFLILIISFGLRATHNRAGEITYRLINGLTYEVTMTTYTKIGAIGDNKCVLDISWGDGSTSTVRRSNGPSIDCSGFNAGDGVPISPTVRKNIYIARHTYAAPGVYILSFEDPNRNSGVRNILNSVNIPFYVESELVISPGLGPNSSPLLINPPIDDGCVKRRFEHNAGAYDPDGDSLAYTLVPCRGANGDIIPTTYDPSLVQDAVRIDSVKGDLYWDVPQVIGQYNFAFRIEEYRKNNQGVWVRIGYVTRDLQVDIVDCNNDPPVIEPIGPFCVEAGEVLSFEVTAWDTNSADVSITLTASGGPFEINNPADPFFVQGPVDTVRGTFRWQTACNHVQQQPHFVTFRAEDFRSANVTPLIDLYTVEITVVAPAPQNPAATANQNSISLNWDESICKEANGYKIYRRAGRYNFIPDSCETGVPAYTGYELIGTTDGLTATSYIDSADLLRGVEYCYMVVACFPDGAVSYASEEFCAALPLTTPLITNVDVTQTSTSTGSIEVRWIRPPVLDTIIFPPPYSYKLYRSEGIEGSNFIEIGTFSGLNDTFFVDNGLNTVDTGYRYRVDLYSDTPEVLSGSSSPASSVFLRIAPADESNELNMTHNTPWTNTEYVIFREINPGSGVFNIIDTAFTDIYIDTGLANGTEYCYYVQTIGAYTASSSLPSPLLNRSQITCQTPIDTTSPCPPALSVLDSCDKSKIDLFWSVPSDIECQNDIAYYNIYYKPTLESSFPSQPFVTNITGNSFNSIGESIVGCYAITAVDDAGNDPDSEPNESDFSNIVCVEACPEIEFPNIFFPNGPSGNNRFIPISFLFVSDFTLAIYNRWGTVVYETSDKDDLTEIGWDGTDRNTGRPCAVGVYYYVCTYTPSSTVPVPQREVKGFVHLFR